MSTPIKIALTVSLLLNILFAGTAAGMLYSKYRHHAKFMEQADLQPETRHMMARTFQHTFREIRETGKEARRARESLIEVLEEKEFSSKRFDEAVKRVKKTQNEIMDIKIRATKELAENLSAEERRKIAGKLASVFDRSMRSKKRGDHASSVKQEGEPRRHQAPLGPRQYTMPPHPDHKPEPSTVEPPQARD